MEVRFVGRGGAPTNNVHEYMRHLHHSAVIEPCYLNFTHKVVDNHVSMVNDQSTIDHLRPKVECTRAARQLPTKTNRLGSRPIIYNIWSSGGRSSEGGKQRIIRRSKYFLPWKQTPSSEPSRTDVR